MSLIPKTTYKFKLKTEINELLDDDKIKDYILKFINSGNKYNLSEEMKYSIYKHKYSDTTLHLLVNNIERLKLLQMEYNNKAETEKNLFLDIQIGKIFTELSESDKQKISNIIKDNSIYGLQQAENYVKSISYSILNKQVVKEDINKLVKDYYERKEKSYTKTGIEIGSTLLKLACVGVIYSGSVYISYENYKTAKTDPLNKDISVLHYLTLPQSMVIANTVIGNTLNYSLPQFIINIPNYISDIFPLVTPIAKSLQILFDFFGGSGEQIYMAQIFIGITGLILMTTLSSNALATLAGIATAALAAKVVLNTIEDVIRKLTIGKNLSRSLPLQNAFNKIIKPTIKKLSYDLDKLYHIIKRNVSEFWYKLSANENYYTLYRTRNIQNQLQNYDTNTNRFVDTTLHLLYNDMDKLNFGLEGYNTSSLFLGTITKTRAVNTIHRLILLSMVDNLDRDSIDTKEEKIYFRGSYGNNFVNNYCKIHNINHKELYEEYLHKYVNINNIYMFKDIIQFVNDLKIFQNKIKNKELYLGINSYEQILTSMNDLYEKKEHIVDTSSFSIKIGVQNNVIDLTFMIDCFDNYLTNRYFQIKRDSNLEDQIYKYVSVIKSIGAQHSELIEQVDKLNKKDDILSSDIFTYCKDPTTFINDVIQIEKIIEDIKTNHINVNISLDFKSIRGKLDTVCSSIKKIETEQLEINKLINNCINDLDNNKQYGYYNDIISDVFIAILESFSHRSIEISGLIRNVNIKDYIKKNISRYVNLNIDIFIDEIINIFLDETMILKKYINNIGKFICSIDKETQIKELLSHFKTNPDWSIDSAKIHNLCYTTKKSDSSNIDEIINIIKKYIKLHLEYDFNITNNKSKLVFFNNFYINSCNDYIGPRLRNGAEQIKEYKISLNEEGSKLTKSLSETINNASSYIVTINDIIREFIQKCNTVLTDVSQTIQINRKIRKIYTNLIRFDQDVGIFNNIRFEHIELLDRDPIAFYELHNQSTGLKEQEQKTSSDKYVDKRGILQEQLNYVSKKYYAYLDNMATDAYLESYLTHKLNYKNIECDNIMNVSSTNIFNAGDNIYSIYNNINNITSKSLNILGGVIDISKFLDFKSRDDEINSLLEKFNLAMDDAKDKIDQNYNIFNGCFTIDNLPELQDMVKEHVYNNIYVELIYKKIQSKDIGSIKSIYFKLIFEYFDNILNYSLIKLNGKYYLTIKFDHNKLYKKLDTIIKGVIYSGKNSGFSKYNSLIEDIDTQINEITDILKKTQIPLDKPYYVAGISNYFYNKGRLLYKALNLDKMLTMVINLQGTSLGGPEIHALYYYMWMKILKDIYILQQIYSSRTEPIEQFTQNIENNIKLHINNIKNFKGVTYNPVRIYNYPASILIECLDNRIIKETNILNICNSDEPLHKVPLTMTTIGKTIIFKGRLYLDLKDLEDIEITKRESLLFDIKSINNLSNITDPQISLIESQIIYKTLNSVNYSHIIKLYESSISNEILQRINDTDKNKFNRLVAIYIVLKSIFVFECKLGKIPRILFNMLCGKTLYTEEIIKEMLKFRTAGFEIKSLKDIRQPDLHYYNYILGDKYLLYGESKNYYENINVINSVDDYLELLEGYQNDIRGINNTTVIDDLHNTLNTSIHVSSFLIEPVLTPSIPTRSSIVSIQNTLLSYLKTITDINEARDIYTTSFTKKVNNCITNELLYSMKEIKGSDINYLDLLELDLSIKYYIGYTYEPSKLKDAKHINSQNFIDNIKTVLNKDRKLNPFKPHYDYILLFRILEKTSSILESVINEYTNSLSGEYLGVLHNIYDNYYKNKERFRVVFSSNPDIKYILKCFCRKQKGGSGTVKYSKLVIDVKCDTATQEILELIDYLENTNVKLR
jgi:hypothetical protein